MAFLKMSLMQNLKELVTKGPTGMVNERMKEHLASADELMKLDPSDPEALRRYTAAKNADVDKIMTERFGKDIISDQNRAHIQSVHEQAIENQARMWKMLQQHQPGRIQPEAKPEQPIDTSKNSIIAK